ncbi:MAG: cupredoxin domain-containing protein [Actinomycetota bacterium]|nr:cupredoxin domain-containing protein [Actinomycetota bacterium]
MLPNHLIRLAAGASAVALLAACNSSAGADSIAVTSTEKECRVESSALKAGKNTFSVRNDGEQVTEVYVYADGDRVVSEKENIGPGTQVSFTADLPAGQYELACKPGQRGAGIRQKITVSGEGGAAARPAQRQVQLSADDYSFAGLGDVGVKVGETIEFAMANRGSVEHEFEVIRPDGKPLGEIGPTKPGASGKVTLTFDKAGTYRFACGIADHEARGMAGTFTVT